jgi:hypothetical protein
MCLFFIKVFSLVKYPQFLDIVLPEGKDFDTKSKWTSG